MSKESVAKTLHQWEQLIAASDANSEDLDHLAKERAELKDLAQKVKRLQEQQDALAAQRQQVTRDCRPQAAPYLERWAPQNEAM